MIWLLLCLAIKKPEIFIIGRGLNISLVFSTDSYFAVSKNIKLNYTHYFIMRIQNKREIQQILVNHSLDIDFWDFMILYEINVLQNSF